MNNDVVKGWVYLLAFFVFMYIVFDLIGYYCGMHYSHCSYPDLSSSLCSDLLPIGKILSCIGIVLTIIGIVMYFRIVEECEKYVEEDYWGE